MAFKIGTYTAVPARNANTHGVELRSGGYDPQQETETDNYWMYPGNPAMNPGSGWKYRSIFTHGYTTLGYKGSNAWRATNKTWHPTDTTLYCGEQMDREGSYLSGTFSDHNGYTENNGHTTAGTNISSLSLSNGQTRKITTTGGFSSSGVPYGYVGNDPLNEGLSYGTASYGNHVGGWNTSTSIHDCAEGSNYIGQDGLWGGGTTTTTSHLLHFGTEIMYTTSSCPYTGLSTGADGENYCWTSHAGNNKASFNWSTRSWATHSGYTYGTDGQPKCLSSKWGYHYVGTGNNVTIGQVKFSDSNGASISEPAKVRAMGEENMQAGQDWGYMMGQYDGQQNNHTVKYNYSNDVQTTLGSTAMPKGHYGLSSGTCFSAAASVCNTGVS